MADIQNRGRKLPHGTHGAFFNHMACIYRGANYLVVNTQFPSFLYVVGETGLTVGAY